MRGKDFYALKEKAAEYVQRTKFERAIGIYCSLLEDYPEDTGVLLKLANVYQTVGKEHAAINCFMSVLDVYCVDAMHQQGIAVCRMILGIDPLHVQAQQRLVELYMKEYGGLPKKRGDTIVPPGYGLEDEPHADSPKERRRAACETGVETRCDSWSPVDVIFSNADARFVNLIENPNLRPNIDVDIDPNAAPNAESEEFGVDITDEVELLDEIEDVKTEAPPLIDRLAQIPLFATVKTRELTRIVEKSISVDFAQNDFILKEGESGDSFFVILKGSVQILKGDLLKPVARLGVGACFGEMALFGLKARRASVIAVESTTLLQIKRTEIDILQHRFPAVRQTLRRNVRERLLDNMLITSALFSPFSEDVRMPLRNMFQSEEFLPYETVIKMDNKVAYLYLIVSGRAEVLLDGPQHRRQLICTMGMGEIFGQVPLLTDSPSKVTVRARGRLSTLCLPKADFNSLMAQHPNIQHLVTEILDSDAVVSNLHR